jgi:hypothetical protein
MSGIGAKQTRATFAFVGRRGGVVDKLLIVDGQ